MPTGPLSDSADPQGPGPPFRTSRRYSWLAKRGRHPVTWAMACLVLLGGAGMAIVLHQPGRRPRAQTVYCGLVTCAVMRSVAATSGVPAGVPNPSPAPSSPTPSSPPAPTPSHTPSRALSPRPAAAPALAPSLAPSPAPTVGPTPKPTPILTPGPPRWPWPPQWPPPGHWPTGDGYHHHHQVPRGYYWPL